MSVEQVEQTGQGPGNTDPGPGRRQSCKWCFTWNNYTVGALEMRSIIEPHCKYLIFEEEVGENGTPHFQGYLELKKRARLTELKKMFTFSDKFHWEIAKGSRRQNFAYCTKSGQNVQKFTTEGSLRTITNEQLYPWQRDFLTVCEEENNDRAIHWVYDRQGNKGKTALIRFLIGNERPVLFATRGTCSDIANLLKNAFTEKLVEPLKPFIFILNLARDCEKVSYRAIEGMKDGLLSNTKYEATQLVFNPPTVWVFSNNKPDFDMLSEDRWYLHKIEDGELIDCERREL